METMREQSFKAMYAACAEWNKSNAVGILVDYWPGIMELPPRSGKTISEAQVLGGHTPGVYIQPGGFIALDHIRAKPVVDAEVYSGPETPESDRLVEARDDAQPVGEFLAWVYAQGLLLCRAEDCRPQGIDHRTTEQLLADWKGIDLAEVERERMALIVQLREHAEAARAVTIGLKVERCELMGGQPGPGYGQVGNVVELTDTKIRVMWLRHDGSNERRTWLARDAEGKRWQRAGATPLLG